MTKSKVLILSSGTLLTHLTPPKDRLPLKSIQITSLLRLLLHFSYPPSQSDKSPHVAQSQRHFPPHFGGLGEILGGVFTFKVIKGTNFFLFVFSHRYYRTVFIELSTNTWSLLTPAHTPHTGLNLQL